MSTFIKHNPPASKPFEPNKPSRNWLTPAPWYKRVWRKLFVKKVPLNPPSTSPAQDKAIIDKLIDSTPVTKY